MIESNAQIRSVDHFAELMNVSPKHLSETMKHHTGKTAGKWINDLVILEAKVKLEQTYLNVNQIADDLQFSDATSFGKYFKKTTGISPLKYRELAQNK